MITEFTKLVRELEATSSNTKKQVILKARLAGKDKTTEKIVKLLTYVYDPYMQFNLTHETAMKKGEEGAILPLSVFQILRKLSARKVTGNAACSLWKRFVLLHTPEQQDILGRVLNKDLKCRLGVATLNKALKQLKRTPVSVHAVSLGNTWKGEKVWEDGELWFASRKLDGVRCHAVLNGKDVPMLSRQGKPFETTSVVSNLLAQWDGPPCILDGELALRKADGKDDFQGLMSEIRRKDHIIENLVFHVFDWIPIAPSSPDLILRARFRHLKDFVIPFFDSPHIKFVPQTRLKGEQHLRTLIHKSQEENWEGLILRKNAYYKATRSKDLWKVKLMQDLEARVVAVNKGVMNIVSKGREEEIDCLTHAIIKYKGSHVSVGSGWSLEQRRRFYAHPEELIGKMITVQYFEETKNKKGGRSLRFPVVKVIHGDNRVT